MTFTSQELDMDPRRAQASHQSI